MDSNHRRHCQQIYSLSHLATLEFPHINLRWSWWTDSNPRPADYKRWQNRQCIDFRCFLPLSRRGFGSIQAYCVHPVHTVMFPFGSRFGSSAFAVHLAYSYALLHVVKVLLHCDFPGKQHTAHLFAVVRYMKSLHAQRYFSCANRLFNRLPHKFAAISYCFWGEYTTNYGQWQIAQGCSRFAPV